MKVLGHRGARNEAPENTLLGIETALRAGAQGVEIDVHLSKDGHLVVIHDDTVDRTCRPATGRVADLTLTQLRALDAGQGQRLPTLHEVLDTLHGRAELFIELKGPACEAAVARLVRERGAEPSCLVKGFDHRQVARAKALAPDLRACVLLVARPVDPVGLVRAANADGLSVNVSYVDADLVAACHAAGLIVCAWNCNRVEDVPALRATGIDWLGTDAPSTIVPATRG